MPSEGSIRAAEAELDQAREAGDVERIVACFAPDCEIELLGVRLEGHTGVRRWLAWAFGHVKQIEFNWAEILTYADDVVTSLRLYFNPLDFAPALPLGRMIGPAAGRLARRGLED